MTTIAHRPAPPIPDNSGKRRHELKYLVPARLLPDLRAFAQTFCVPDRAATGHPPRYQVTTLQFDDEHQNLHLAKERETLQRFKLRVRTYGEPGTHPEFLEVKRRLEHLVLKTRCKLPPNTFSAAFMHSHSPDLPAERQENYWEFRRLMKQIGARPAMLIRYQRESWVGQRNPAYRMTFDTRLQYSVCKDWSLRGSGDWRPFDTGTAFPFREPPLVLELKSPEALPDWMLRVIRFFNLQRVGFCKYSAAARLESLFDGHSYSDASENTTYR